MFVLCSCYKSRLFKYIIALDERRGGGVELTLVRKAYANFWMWVPVRCVLSLHSMVVVSSTDKNRVLHPIKD